MAQLGGLGLAAWRTGLEGPGGGARGGPPSLPLSASQGAPREAAWRREPLRSGRSPLGGGVAMLARGGEARRIPSALAPPPPPRVPPLPPLLRPLPSPPALPPPPSRRPPTPLPPLRRSFSGERSSCPRGALWELGPRLAAEAQRQRALLQTRQFVEAAARGHRFYRESLRPALEAQRRFDRQLQFQRQAGYAELLRLLLRQEKGESPSAKELLAPIQALARTLPPPKAGLARVP